MDLGAGVIVLTHNPSVEQTNGCKPAKQHEQLFQAAARRQFSGGILCGPRRSGVAGTQIFRVHLVDIRHTPTNEDVMMTNYLRHYDIPFTVIATKADKLSKAQRSRSIPVICRTLAVQPWEVMVYSSEDLTGRDALLEKIGELLAEPVEEAVLPEEDIAEDGE